VPDAIISPHRSDEPLGVGHSYEVRFAWQSETPFGSSKDPQSGSPQIPEEGPITTGRFSKITGLREEIERVSWRDGTEPFRVRHGPGTLSGGVVTFEKGVVRAPLSLLRWFSSIRFFSQAMANRLTLSDVNSAINPILIDGTAISSHRGAGTEQIPPADDFGLFANVDILIGEGERLDDERPKDKKSVASVRRIGLYKCWPVAYQVSDLEASTSSIALESLSVSFDEMRVGRALVP